LRQERAIVIIELFLDSLNITLEVITLLIFENKDVEKLVCILLRHLNCKVLPNEVSFFVTYNFIDIIDFIVRVKRQDNRVIKLVDFKSASG